MPDSSGQGGVSRHYAFNNARGLGDSFVSHFSRWWYPTGNHLRWLTVMKKPGIGSFSTISFGHLLSFCGSRSRLLLRLSLTVTALLLIARVGG